jgi:hypothetical protein
MLVQENSGYKLFCEMQKLDINGQNYVRIYSTYDWAKNPDAEQNKMELFLTDSELAQFRMSLNPY